MKSNVVQNCLVIRLVCECLTKSGFKNVVRNRDQGTFPDIYATALDITIGIEYLVAITGRVETKADGTWDLSSTWCAPMTTEKEHEHWLRA